MNFTLYWVIRCPHCGLFQYVKASQKTRRCPKCSVKFEIEEKKVLIFSKTFILSRAVEMVQQLKEREAL